MRRPTTLDPERAALASVVAAVAAMLPGGDGLVARRVRAAALALLRPAEAALRRLIVVAAAGLAVVLGPPRPAPLGLRGRPRRGGRAFSFRLVDPAWRLPRLVPAPLQRAEGGPRIRVFWAGPFAPPAVAPPAPAVTAPRARQEADAPVEAARLRRRLLAMQRALANLPREARRLARWRARQAERRAAGRAVSLSPLRVGQPPGQRRRSLSPLDELLRRCHELAIAALAPDAAPRSIPDSS